MKPRCPAARWNTSPVKAQGDYAVLDQRDDMLWMDAGMVTTQADWSLDFDIGMNFFEWHAPVPQSARNGHFQARAEVPVEHSAGRALRAV